MNKKFLLAVPVIGMLIACGANSEGSESDIARLNEQAAKDNAPSVADKGPANKVSTITEGDWEVGTKDNFSANVLTPGTYVITSPEDGIMGCYWTAVKDFTGDAKSIISAGLVEAGKSGRMVVKKSYGGVTLQGDCLAKKKKG